jgi:hypothetical protein
MALNKFNQYESNYLFPLIGHNLFIYHRTHYLVLLKSKSKYFQNEIFFKSSFFFKFHTIIKLFNLFNHKKFLCVEFLKSLNYTSK